MYQKGLVAVWDPVPGRYRRMYPQRAYAMVPLLVARSRRREATGAEGEGVRTWRGAAIGPPRVVRLQDR